MVIKLNYVFRKILYAIKQQQQSNNNLKSNMNTEPLFCEDEKDKIITGIICKKCRVELPPMLMSEHLDIHNHKNKMCGCYKK